MNKKKARSGILGISALLFLTVLLAGGTYGWLKQEAEVNNELASHTTEVTIEEKETEFQVENNTTQDKHAALKNSGSSAVLLRIACAETWEAKGEGGSVYLLSNQVGGIDVAEKNWTDLGVENDELWFEGKDGWFYFKKILLPGETTGDILESVTFPSFTGDYEIYGGAEYHLVFRAEVVQASTTAGTLNAAEVNADAARTVFGMTVSVDPGGSGVTWSSAAPRNSGEGNSR